MGSLESVSSFVRSAAPFFDEVRFRPPFRPTFTLNPHPKAISRCSVSSDGLDDTVNLARSSGSSLSLLLPVLQVRPSLRAGADDLLLAGPTLSVLLNSNSQTQVIAARDRTGGSAVGKLSSVSRCSLAAQATFDAGC